MSDRLWITEYEEQKKIRYQEFLKESAETLSDHTNKSEGFYLQSIDELLK